MIKPADLQIWLRGLESQLDFIQRSIQDSVAHYCDDVRLAIFEVDFVDEFELLRFQRKHLKEGCLAVCSCQGEFAGLKFTFPLPINRGCVPLFYEGAPDIHCSVIESELALVRYPSLGSLRASGYRPNTWPTDFQGLDLECSGWPGVFFKLTESLRERIGEGQFFLKFGDGQILSQPLNVNRDPGSAEPHLEDLDRSVHRGILHDFRCSLEKSLLLRFCQFSTRRHLCDQVVKETHTKTDEATFLPCQRDELHVFDINFSECRESSTVSFRLTFQSGLASFASKGIASMKVDSEGHWKLDFFRPFDVLLEAVRERLSTGLGPPGFFFGRVTQGEDSNA